MKNPKMQKIMVVLWGCIATYFILVSIAGLFVARNFDTTNGYQKDTTQSLLIALAFGAIAAVACFGLLQKKSWSRGVVFALSGVSILYAASFFANNAIQSSGSGFVALLFMVSAFSILATWKKGNNAQPQR
jgi:peptidoglycan/LPS O-acetylase OafA/YrhL